MKLREYVSSALMEISYGVQDAIARRDAEGLIGRINPAFPDPTDHKLDWTKLVEKVEFDLAVTDSNSKEVGGSGGLEVVALAKLEAKGTTKSEYTAVNRVRFSVPVLFPVQITEPR